MYVCITPKAMHARLLLHKPSSSLSSSSLAAPVKRPPLHFVTQRSTCFCLFFPLSPELLQSQSVQGPRSNDIFEEKNEKKLKKKGTKNVYVFVPFLSHVALTFFIVFFYFLSFSTQLPMKVGCGRCTWNCQSTTLINRPASDLSTGLGP
eukprot:Tamp_26056.p1 GENE.Tamp_26056~~Tamp_26056.p1  ORF type:complete len:149 (+),score=5.21 Tamp_26056:226-672(+)